MTDDTPGTGKPPLPDAHEGDNASPRTSMSDSEDSIRSLKASQSVEAAFQAIGIPSPPGDIANTISSYVKSATTNIPASRIANMTAGSGELGASAVRGVNEFIAMLTPDQRMALSQGRNPFDPVALDEIKIGRAHV